MEIVTSLWQVLHLPNFLLCLYSAGKIITSLKEEKIKQVKPKVQGYSPFRERGFCGEPFLPWCIPQTIYPLEQERGSEDRRKARLTEVAASGDGKGRLSHSTSSGWMWVKIHIVLSHSLYSGSSNSCVKQSIRWEPKLHLYWHELAMSQTGREHSQSQGYLQAGVN